MKQLKLEVGKTYRSRRGKDVEIIGKNGKGRYPYNGSDGQLYAENGKYIFDVEEDPDDLIEEAEEVPEPTRHTFTIPDGVKEITLDYFGNRIVVEMAPEAKGPKPGDVMVNDIGSVYIFKEAVSKHTHRHYAWFGRDGRVVFNESAISGRPATPEEAKPLWDALKKAGKRWSPETMQVEDVPEIERILEWVEENIKEGYYNHEDVAEAIEGYLKQKEGTK